MRHPFAICWLVLATTPPLVGDTILIDDFNDGDDVGWTRVDTSVGTAWGPGSVDPSSGSYVFQGGGDVPTGEQGIMLALYDASTDPTFQDGYLRATARTENDTLAYLVMRGDLATFSAYVFGASATTGRFWWNKVVNNVIFEEGPTFAPDPPFGVGEDWIIEGGVVGDQLSVKIWRVGEPEPAVPQWTHTDNTLTAGQFGLGANHWAEQPPSAVSATFDDVYFTFVPEPNALAIAVLLIPGALIVGAVRRARVAATALLIAMLAPCAYADKVFIDTFDDTETPPVQWTPGTVEPGDYKESSGDYVFTPTVDSEAFMVSDALDFSLRDTSVRAQGRVSAEGGAIILTARNQDATDSHHYFGGIGYFADLGGTILFAGRNDAGTSRIFFTDVDPVLPFDVRAEDAVVQLDVIGKEISLWAWRHGDSMPTAPQITGNDDTYADGWVRIASTTENGNVTTFRYVGVADTHIVPESSGLAIASLLTLGMLAFVKRHRRKLSAIVSAVAMIVSGANAHAATILLDTFNDGDATDGMPAAWTALSGFSNGDYSAVDNNYVLTGDGSGNAIVAYVSVPSDDFPDVSLRTQVRTDGPADGVALFARFDENALVTYQGGIDSNGNVYIGWNNPTYHSLNITSTPLRVANEDILLQFDVFGDSLRLYAWRPGEPRPQDATVQVSDQRFAAGGIGLLNDPQGLTTATFAFVHAATHQIMNGDATDDGVIDVNDLNAVRNNFGSGDGSDQTGIPGDSVPYDGFVDIDDLNVVRNNFGAGTSAVPEPTGRSLAAIVASLAACGTIFRRFQST